MKLFCLMTSEEIDERIFRINALFVLVISIIGIYFESYIIFDLLTIEYVIRAFYSFKYSPISNMSKLIAKYIFSKPNMVNAGPKIFAARLAFCISLAVTFLYYNKNFYMGNIFAIILCFCTFLDSILGICLGCILYSYLIKFRGKNI